MICGDVSLYTGNSVGWGKVLSPNPKEREANRGIMITSYWGGASSERMAADYLSTMLGISAQIIAVVIAFYVAYEVYLRQQRDKYREKSVGNFQNLDKLITQ